MKTREYSPTPTPHLDIAPDDSTHARLNGNASADSSYFPTPRRSTDSESDSEDAVRDAIRDDDDRGIEETLERLGFGELTPDASTGGAGDFPWWLGMRQGRLGPECVVLAGDTTTSAFLSCTLLAAQCPIAHSAESTQHRHIPTVSPALHAPPP
jgi:hypothetical protein